MSSQLELVETSAHLQPDLYITLDPVEVLGPTPNGTWQRGTVPAQEALSAIAIVRTLRENNPEL